MRLNVVCSFCSGKNTEEMSDSSMVSKNLLINDGLYPGMWSKVDFFIPPGEFSKFDSLAVNINPGAISFEGNTKEVIDRLKAIKLINSISK